MYTTCQLFNWLSWSRISAINRMERSTSHGCESYMSYAQRWHDERMGGRTCRPLPPTRRRISRKHWRQLNEDSWIKEMFDVSVDMSSVRKTFIPNIFLHQCCQHSFHNFSAMRPKSTPHHQHTNPTPATHKHTQTHTHTTHTITSAELWAVFDDNL